MALQLPYIISYYSFETWEVVQPIDLEPQKEERRHFLLREFVYLMSLTPEVGSSVLIWEETDSSWSHSYSPVIQQDISICSLDGVGGSIYYGNRKEKKGKKVCAEPLVPVKK